MDGAKGTNVASYGFFEGIGLRVGHSVDTVKIIVVRVYEFAIATLLFTVSTLTFYQIQTLEGWRQDYWWEANNYGNLSAHMWGIISPAIADEMIFGKTDKIATEEAAKKEKAEKAAEEEKTKAKLEKEAAQKAAEAKKSSEPEGPGFWGTLWNGAAEINVRASRKHEMDKGIADAKKELEKAMTSLVEDAGITGIDRNALESFKAQAKKKFEAVQSEANKDFERLVSESSDKDFGGKFEALARGKREKYFKEMSGEINKFLKIVKRASLAAFFDGWYYPARGRIAGLPQDREFQDKMRAWWLANTSSILSDDTGDYTSRVAKAKEFHDRWQYNINCSANKVHFPTQMAALERYAAQVATGEGLGHAQPLLDALGDVQATFQARLGALEVDGDYNSVYDAYAEQVGTVIRANNVAAAGQTAVAAVAGLTPAVAAQGELGYAQRFRSWTNGKLAGRTEVAGDGSKVAQVAEWIDWLGSKGLEDGWLPDVPGKVTGVQNWIRRGGSELSSSIFGTGVWTVFGVVAIYALHPLASILADGVDGGYFGGWGLPVIGKWPIVGLYNHLVPKAPLDVLSLSFNIAAVRHFPFFTKWIVTNYSLNYMCSMAGLGSPFPNPLSSVKYGLTMAGWAVSFYNSLPNWTTAVAKFIASGFALYSMGQFVVRTVVQQVQEVTGPVLRATKAVTDTGQSALDWGKWVYEKLPAKS